jgi:hypothetical protein
MSNVTIRKSEPEKNEDELQKLQKQINEVKAMLESMNVEGK